MTVAFEDIMRSGGRTALHQASLQLAERDSLVRAVDSIAQFFTEHRVHYAFVGTVARVVQGCFWGTGHIDVQVRDDCLQTLVSTMPTDWNPVVSRRGLSATVEGVMTRIACVAELDEVVLVDGIACQTIGAMIASALRVEHPPTDRLTAQVIVLEAIRKLGLGATFAQQLPVDVRASYREMQSAVASSVTQDDLLCQR